MITIEMIDEFQKRTNCSYQEAKLYLERNNGNVVDAIVDFEQTHSQANNRPKPSGLRNFLRKMYQTRFMVEDKGTAIVNLSVLFCGIFILLTLPVLPLYIISVVVALLLGYRFRIAKYYGENVDIHQMVKDATQNVTSQQKG